MRNKGKILLLALTLLCCAAFAVYQYRYLRTADREPPKISMAQQELTLSVSDPDTRLLEGMSATDARDGDVTPSLIVESVRGVVADKRFTVTYAAFDRAGNVAKAQRTVFYSDYTSPRFSLSAPLIFRAGVSPDAFAPLSAQDVFDGDLTERIKGTLIRGGSMLREAGDYTVQFRVTNALGDTSYLTAPVLLTDGGTGSAEITLETYLLYLKTGDAFSPRQYLQELNAGGQTFLLDHAQTGVDVEVSSNVDTAVTGTYYVDYTVTYGRYTGRSRLLVVVED